MPECERLLFKRTWKGVNGEVAHIAGEKEGSARYEATMSDDDRRGFANLIVVCPSCHNLIDNLEPDDYTVDRLREIKEQHESRAEDGASHWADEALLDRYVALAMEMQFNQPNQNPAGAHVNIEAGASVSATPTRSESAIVDEPAYEDDKDQLVRHFLRQRFQEGAQSLTPEMIADGVPLGIEEVRLSLGRLHKLEAIEGVTVEEVDYPVQVTGLR